ncbi:ATP-grasp fold amidoligase family protein [Paenibacillus terrigena]|uniref:ATP-grasp fold amidoligase family protein n=1 Tax=Paenibacillus terrigena TaxID=369333 RepID=UPI00036314FB|nr:ATP-grasp fold amidoligase family protein [Paenibacillus terrigena]
MQALKETIRRQESLMNMYKFLNQRINNAIYQISPVLLTKKLYKETMGTRLDLVNPKDFNEKLQWLKLYWQHPLVAKCADKYTVREYIEECGYSEILNELYGVYDQSQDVDFGALPNQFAIKCTHGCGFNIICSDLSAVNTEEMREKLDGWMKTRYSLVAAEVQYDKMKPRIICEKYLGDAAGNTPADFKVYCFHGKAVFILACTDRNTGVKFSLYDKNWELFPYRKWNSSKNIDKPITLDQMLRVSEALSQPFPFVRIDYYEYEGQLILGEMSFTPTGCLDSQLEEETSLYMGNLITLPGKYKPNSVKNN